MASLRIETGDWNLSFTGTDEYTDDGLVAIDVSSGDFSGSFSLTKIDTRELVAYLIEQLERLEE